MSRCFPFPPPGYEKKLGPEDVDLLKKEKVKEKKHKEKKDKDKKEAKDKREKEKSDKKHREKKDKKEKHKDKDKKKDKDKDREKDHEKGSTSEVNRDVGQHEDYNGVKLHQREIDRVKEKKEKSTTTVDKGLADQFEGCNGEKFHQKVEKYRNRSSTSDEKKPPLQFQGDSGGKPIQKVLQKDVEDSKFMLEFGRRIRDEGKGPGSQLVERCMDMERKNDEGIERCAVRDAVFDGKEKRKVNEVGNWKMDGQTFGHDDKFNGYAMSQNLAESVENKYGVPKLIEKVDRRIDGKEKSKERESDKRRDKRESKYKDKHSQGNDKNREQEKQMEDKTKEEHKKSEDTTKSSNRMDLIGTPSNEISHFSRGPDKISATEINHKKRKDVDNNGFLHDRPEKMPRLTSHPLSDNGKELKPSETITLFTPHRQGTANSLKVDAMEHKTNGLVGAHQLPTSEPKPSAIISDQIAEVSRKSPHPDMKYLSKVLSVPQMEKWSELDDQEWLFDCKDSLLDKSKVGSVGVNQEQQVWAEVLKIESADVFALPYVIPY